MADPGANGIPYRNGTGTAAPATANNLSGPFFCQDAGYSGAYACNLTPPITAYQTGTTYWFKANTINTGAATINFNSLVPKRIMKQANQDLAPGDVKAGQWVVVTYDGTNMQMQSQTANPPVSGVATVFGRSGAVVAQSGDYTTAQISENGNLYFTNARAWAALSASGPVTFNGATGTFNCPTCITSATSADTDLYGSFPHLSVVRLQGRPIAVTSPADLQYLGWNAFVGQWEPKTVPAAPVTSIFGRSGAVSAAAGDYTTALVTESSNLYFTSARVWAALSANGPIAFNGSGTFSCPTCITSATSADTDLSGNFPHLTVAAIQGRRVASAPPADLQYLGWNISANQWEPKTLPGAPVTSVFGRTGAIVPQSGDYSFTQVAGAASASQLPVVAMRTDQSNAVATGTTQDFSKAAHTLPMQSGVLANLPGTCTIGETYFATNAPAGADVYGCTIANTWTAQGTLTVESDGLAVGTRRTLNFVTGTGLVTVITDDGTEINVQSALDTSVAQTQMGDQSGATLLCASTGALTSNYRCSLSPTLTTYTMGMLLRWLPDVNGVGGSTTLNVDTLGNVPIKLVDGVTNPTSANIVGGQLYDIWYDGAVFRLPATVATGSGGAVSSVFGRAGAVTAQSGDYTTALVTESGNLYFTNTRAQSAMSGLYESPLTFSGPLSRTGNTISLPAATSGQNGYLASADWSTFNAKQAAISGAPGTWPSFGGAALLNVGTTTGTVAAGDDTRMTNARAPTAHAASHQNGGSDEVATATPGANAIPKAGAGGTLAAGWIPTLNQSTTGNAATATTITGALALANTPLTVRGDLLVATTAAPTLGKLAKGTQYQTLQGGATDPGYDAVHLDQATAVTGILPAGNLPGSGASTVNGQTCTLGSGCNANSGAAAHSVALNEGNGSAIGGVGPGTTGQLLAAVSSGDPNYKSLADSNPTEYAAGGGTAQAQTVTLAPAATALSAGLTVRWLPAAANTAAAPTLTVNSLTAKPITKCGAAPLLAGDLTTTAVATATYDGTEFQLLNPQAAQCGTFVNIVDAPSWQICNPAGCGSETSNGYYAIMNPNGVTFDECGVNLAIAATGSSVIVDVQDSTGTSIFGATKLVIPINTTTEVFQATFSSSPYTAAKGAKFRAAVTQNDSGGTAQFAYVRCRVH